MFQKNGNAMVKTNAHRGYIHRRRDWMHRECEADSAEKWDLRVNIDPKKIREVPLTKT
jgi:hypothetical protein